MYIVSSTIGDLHINNNCKINSCANFNGINNYDNYIKSNNIINNIRSISLWLNTNQTKGPWKYVFDGKSGLDGTWITSYNGINGFGYKIIKMYVNGKETNIDWLNIPLNQWNHLYFEFFENFNDDINLMSKYSNNECLQGMVDEFRIYSRPFSNS